MALTDQQLATAARRKNRLLELCAAFPEVEADELAKEHIAFKVRKKIFARPPRRRQNRFYVQVQTQRAASSDPREPERRRLDRDRRTLPASLPADRPEETRDARVMIGALGLTVAIDANATTLVRKEVVGGNVSSS